MTDGVRFPGPHERIMVDCGTIRGVWTWLVWQVQTDRSLMLIYEGPHRLDAYDVARASGLPVHDQTGDLPTHDEFRARCRARGWLQ